MHGRDQPRPTRYAVIFRVGPEEATAGALVLDTDGLQLERRTADGPVELSIPYTELTDVGVGRTPRERLNGRPVLVLGRKGAPSVQIGPLGLGFLGEIIDLLAPLVSHAPDRSDRVAVTVPLKKGRLTQAEELVAQGPPFDPAALGFTQHQVFLSAHEATFVFVGPQAQATLARASRDPTLWHFGLAWRDCIAGRPRLSTTPEIPPGNAARLAYTWDAADSASSPPSG